MVVMTIGHILINQGGDIMHVHIDDKGDDDYDDECDYDYDDDDVVEHKLLKLLLTISNSENRCVRLELGCLAIDRRVELQYHRS